MSFTGFVLAFAGAMAAKVRPAPRERRLEAFELKAENEALQWALDVVRGNLGQVCRERDALRAELQRIRSDRRAYAAQMEQMQAMAQAQQNALGLYAAQQNAALANYYGAQAAQQQQLAQAAQNAYTYDCTCVPGRAAALGCI